MAFKCWLIAEMAQKQIIYLGHTDITPVILLKSVTKDLQDLYQLITFSFMWQEIHFRKTSSVIFHSN